MNGQNETNNQTFFWRFNSNNDKQVVVNWEKKINRRYNYLREIIYEESKKTDEEIRKWVIEVDESYFWARRVRWKRWRWASWKTKVLWLLKREGKVYVRIVPDCSAKTLIPIIRRKVSVEDSKINTDYWKSYDGLVDLWYEKHYRVKHSKKEPVAFNGIVKGSISLELRWENWFGFDPLFIPEWYETTFAEDTEVRDSLSPFNTTIQELVDYLS